MEPREQQPAHPEIESTEVSEDKEKYSAEALRSFLEIRLPRNFSVKKTKKALEEEGGNVTVTVTANFDIWLTDKLHDKVLRQEGIDWSDIVFEDRYDLLHPSKFYYKGLRFYSHGEAFDNFIKSLGRETVLAIIIDKIEKALGIEEALK